MPNTSIMEAIDIDPDLITVTPPPRRLSLKGHAWLVRRHADPKLLLAAALFAAAAAVSWTSPPGSLENALGPALRILAMGSAALALARPWRLRQVLRAGMVEIAHLLEIRHGRGEGFYYATLALPVDPAGVKRRGVAFVGRPSAHHVKGCPVLYFQDPERPATIITYDFHLEGFDLTQLEEVRAPR